MNEAQLRKESLRLQAEVALLQSLFIQTIKYLAEDNPRLHLRLSESARTIARSITPSESLSSEDADLFHCAVEKAASDAQAELLSLHDLLSDDD